MNREKIEAAFSRHPDWQIFVNKHAQNWWIDVIASDEREFVVQVASNGEVGVTDRNNLHELDISIGHDEVFADLASAVASIEKSLRG